MTSYRFRTRAPMPVARDRFRAHGAPSRIFADFGPAFLGGPFREAIRALQRDDEHTRGSARSKPRTR
jgi:hypothetical protein